MQIDPATIIFAFLALFVLWKLRSVLGERTGLEQKPNEGRGAVSRSGVSSAVRRQRRRQMGGFCRTRRRGLERSGRHFECAARICAARFPRWRLFGL